MERILKAEKIRFSYNGVEVLKEIDVSFFKKETVGILGANGAGKSTLLKILCGILEPSKGRVFYNEKDLKKTEKKELARKVAYVPQHPFFAFPFSVKEVVLMGRAPHIGRFEFEREKDWEIALNAMETVGIAHLKNRLVTEISGGERQLVSLARALAQEPELMILDEPATFLDVKHRTETMKLLNTLKEEKGLSVIAATHDIFSTLYFDRLVFLKDGRVFAQGKGEDVLKGETLSAVYGIEVIVKKEGGRVFVFPVN
ncbi:MAG: iron ABC transporter ATP-binding protein [Deltaproteobacteria bacterium]|jgi:iron complex transport system ATP-binding protein|nr:MAG: iron ABC transporter ATP-binding protein [Deltaproteobacteria bacterium]